LEPLADVVRRSDLIVVGVVQSSRQIDGEYDEFAVRVLSTIRGGDAATAQISARRGLSIEPDFKRDARCLFLLRHVRGRVIATSGYASVVCDSDGDADFVYFADVARGVSFDAFVDRIRELAMVKK
jgi:hypothetical protein